MTEEDKLAKGYAIGRTYPRFENDFVANFVLREVEGAFLAGLKAGRPEWHKVADGDLPKENKPVIAIYNFIDELVPILTLYRDKKWVNIFQNYTDIVHPIIAWKEIVLPELPKE